MYTIFSWFFPQKFFCMQNAKHFSVSRNENVFSRNKNFLRAALSEIKTAVMSNHLLCKSRFIFFISIVLYYFS